MKIRLLVVGKTHSEFDELITNYTNRLKRYIDFKIDVIPDLKKGKKINIDEIKIREEKLILDKINNTQQVILLDEKGNFFSSNDFAKYLQNKMNQAIKELTFIVGGAYGFSEKVYQRVNYKISLSQMTFSHQMIRLFFVEQIYRSFTILNNEPYHHQ